MKEEKDNTQMCHWCGHHESCGYHDHKNYLLRWILGVIVLVLVFWFGVQVGQVGSGWSNDYYPMMPGQGYGSGPSMMMYRQSYGSDWPMGYSGSYQAAPVSSQSNSNAVTPSTTVPKTR